MRVTRKTKKELIAELEALRLKVEETGALSAEPAPEHGLTFQALFEGSPISIWIEDFSEVKRHIDSLTESGIKDLEKYCEENPDEVSNCAGLVKIVDVNKSSVELYNASSREELLENLPKVFTEGSLANFKEQLKSIAAGATNLETEVVNRKLTGEDLLLLLRWQVVPGYEDSYSRVIVSMVDITERKLAEEAISRSEAEKALILETMSEMVVYLDLDMRILWVNKGAADAVGKKPDDLVGGYCYEVWHQRKVPCDICPVKEARKTGKRQTKDFDTPEGRHLHISAYPVKDESGRILSVIEIVEDRTERKQALLALEESKERYRVVVEGTDDLITIVDSEGNFEYVNHVAEKILGVKPDKCIGIKAFDFIHPDDKERTTEWFVKCIKNKSASGTFENRQINRMTGDIRYLHWTSNFHYDEEGSVSKVTAIARDLTEWKSFEEMLKASEQRFRAIVTNAQAIIFIIDKDGRFLLSEGKALSVLGLEPGQVVGLSAYDVYAAYPSITQAIKDTLRGEFVSDILDLDGIYFDIFYSPHLDQEGNIVGTIGMAIDITERKRSEEALIRSEQLAAVGEIASGIAHELNNPLATIMGCTESLIGRLDQSDLLPSSDREFVREYLHMILTEVSHSSNIIQELLDFSRIRPLTLEPLQISDLILTTVHLMDIQSRYRDYIFTVRSDENLPDIVGDGSRLKQVLIVLLTNAVESMIKGGEITITVEHDAVGKQIVIRIQDEGVGIGEQDIQKIFEPYYTTNITERGTGLGLSIARNIIEKHSGTIEVASVVNKGSTFTVKLPV